jgi:putative membrane protein
LLRHLTRTEAAALEAHVARVEARTGVQVVTAVIGRADNYIELPWKAFALGASAAGLALVTADALRPQWVTSYTALVHATTMLAAGAAAALLAIFVPPFARLFLRAARRDVEVRQYAQALFLARDLVATRDRTAVLILISLFERRIEIVADRGLADRVAETEWCAVIARMAPHLGGGRPFRALEDCLDAVAELLATKGFRGGAGSNDLSNRPIEERGA